MTDITADCTQIEAVPQMNLKIVTIVTPATAATTDEIDMSKWGISKIYNVILQADGGTGGPLDATWSGSVITLPTITTGIHHLTVVGAAV